MSISLGDALQQGIFQAGRTYRCRAMGHTIEVRVLDIPPEMLPAPLYEGDLMLDAWVELPGPESAEGVAARSRLGTPDLPDVPEIPPEDEAS
jgi:hypothetical protein